MAINKKTVDMITAQASVKSIKHPQDTSDLYAEDVQLISKDGKIYYLPMGKAEWMWKKKNDKVTGTL